MAASRPAFYKEVLTPALHRRFTSSALLVLYFCYIEAILITEKSSLIWPWFPIGVTGIRTSLLFISALSIFVLRVASLHLGARNTPSPFTTFSQNAIRLNTIQTISWYVFSAWWFSEVYIWSASDKADLNWITQGKAWERKKLNERSIYLRSVFFMFAISQSLLHLYYDYDLIPLPITPPQADSIAPQARGFPAWFASTVDILKPMFLWDVNNMPISISQNVLLRSLCISLLAPFIYGIFIRRTVWSWSSSFAALLWDVPPSRLSYVPPHYPSLIYKSMTAGVLLNFLWQSSNALFKAYVARPPIKNDQPLSSESKDPIGTLLNGLKSKKETPKTFAFWELYLITSFFPDRRKAIFTDIDRPSGAAWTQILSLCLNNIMTVNTRINNFLDPSTTASKTASRSQQQPATIIETLPRISTPLRKENVFSNPPSLGTPLEKLESNVGTFAKSYGQSPSQGTLRIPYGSQAQFLLNSGSQKLLSSPATQKLLTSGGQQQQLSLGGVRNLMHEYTMRFVRSGFGQPFRQTFARRVGTVVLGTPYARLYSIITSIKALTNLASASLEEDPYGRVSKDIPTLIRTFCSTIETIETFVENLPPHWTDVDFKDDDRTEEDVEMVVQCMKSGIREILYSFGQYTSELGMGAAEVSAARRLAGIETES
ncbi:MAG: hypothetical protein Q9217_005474 [Psora testacea]